MHSCLGHGLQQWEVYLHNALPRMGTSRRGEHKTTLVETRESKKDLALALASLSSRLSTVRTLMSRVS